MKKIFLHASQFFTNDTSLLLAPPFHTGLSVSCNRVGDLKWVYMPLPLCEGDVIREVSIVYKLSKARSFISQVRLSQQDGTDRSIVVHDDGTDLRSITPSSYKSVVNNVKVESSMLLSLRLNFTNIRDSISLAYIEIGYDQGEQAPESFTVHRNSASFVPPRIVLQYGQDPAHPGRFTGFNWADIYRGVFPIPSYSDETAILGSVLHLQEAIQKMTGRTLDIVSQSDISTGVVLTTLKGSPHLANIPEIRQALLEIDGDVYQQQEAFYICSYPERVLVVANTAAGLAAAIPCLLESLGYEVLGMGPNWTHIPKGFREELSFSIRTSDRPGYLYRSLWATSGQNYGVGTLNSYYAPSLPDEPVEQSYLRWLAGTRMLAASMPAYHGHSLQGFHKSVVEHMKAHNTTEGFLCRTRLGLSKDRPEAGESTNGLLWINTDLVGPEIDKVYFSFGTDWHPQNLSQLEVNLDLSVPFVRQYIFESNRDYAIGQFEKYPDDIVNLCAEPEDGSGYTRIREARYPNWYPDYLAGIGIRFGNPYALHGFYELNQPNEIWDTTSPSDHVFGLANWLTYELDRWIDSLPVSERRTVTGKDKKSLLKLTHYSYGFHDVPPNFNLRTRIRVMVSGYANNRGIGKWKNFKSRIDMGLAFRKLAPSEYPAHYEYLSLATSSDYNLNMLQPLWPSSAEAIFKRFDEYNKAGFRALSAEIDFNFGKHGLGYYLIAKFLWKPSESVTELNAIRDKWFKMAFGSAWSKMKTYYDFLLPENFGVNAPRTWATAVRLLDEADHSLNPSTEPDEKKRIDDVKQYWYYYYLLHTGKNEPDNPEMRTFLWKGQMSYMTAMHMIIGLIYGKTWLSDVFGDTLNGTPAHFSAAETQIWWSQIREHWQESPVNYFKDFVLQNGVPARGIDLNDLVCVKEFDELGINPYYAQPIYYPNTEFSFLIKANSSGESIGCQHFYSKSDTDSRLFQSEIAFFADYWNPSLKQWEPLIERGKGSASTTTATSIFVSGGDCWLAKIQITVPRAGVYRITITTVTVVTMTAPLSFNIEEGTHGSSQNGLVSIEARGGGTTDTDTWFYIPQGITHLDLEEWGGFNESKVVLYSTPPAYPGAPGREVRLGEVGTKRIALEPMESGNLARLVQVGFAFPLLYSVPLIWAKSPKQLMVPRAIAEADGLTIIST